MLVWESNQPGIWFQPMMEKFDIPLVWKVGYNINNKIDLAINYRLGFTNVIDDRIYKKGHISDLNLSIFIPFTISKK